MNPIQLGKGPNGLPAIQWARHGVAAKGEPSTVHEVVEYPSEAERDQALSDHLDRKGLKARSGPPAGCRTPLCNCGAQCALESRLDEDEGGADAARERSAA